MLSSLRVLRILRPSRAPSSASGTSLFSSSASCSSSSSSSSDVPPPVQPNRTIRVLIVDGYASTSRAEFATNGLPLASCLYKDMLSQQAPRGVTVDFETVFPCDPDYTPPSAEAMSSFDGCAFTGSSYSVFTDTGDVTRQIDLMRQTFECGVSSFGSCWGLQVAAVALGGQVEASHKGREVGFGRKIAMTAAGRAHPMFTGKKTTYEAFMSHSDEIIRVPSGGIVTAGNDHTRVQAMAVTRNGTESWFVQYHPEYDLGYFAGLIASRQQRMMDMGFFQTEEAHSRYVADLQTLHADQESEGGCGARKDLRWKYSIDEDLLNPDIKRAEVRNWIKLLLNINPTRSWLS